MSRKVDAIILAAGSLGRQRMYSKALIEVDGKSILQRQIEWLRPFVKGIIVACTGDEAKQIKQYHPDFDVTFATTPDLPGTAGSLKRAFDLATTDDVLVVNVDDLTDIDVSALINFGPNTICVANPRLRYAKIDMDGHNITSFREKPLLEGVWVSCGIYFLNKNIVEKLPLRGNVAKDFFPYVKLKAYKHFGTWHTIEENHLH